MNFRRLAAGVTIGVMAASIAGVAQQEQPPQNTAPLGDLARQAEAAKATVKRARKTYTNADLSTDLRGEPTPALLPPPSGFVSKTLGTVVPPDEMLARSEAKVESEKAGELEETWRMRAVSLRKQIDEVQSRITTLTTPNALKNSDAGVKRANDVDVANARTALEGLKRKWTRLEAVAREAKIPSEWLDPRPQLQ